MERPFHHNSYYGKWNNQVLPVVIYLTLPTVSCQPTSVMATGKQRRSQRQKQRDQKRLLDFTERKSVCSLLPFYGVDNHEIQNMIPRQQLSFVPSKTIKKDVECQFNKIMELQAEIKQLHLTTDHLRASILNERRKHSELEKENSYLKNERIKGQEKLRDAENLVSNLNGDINKQQNKLTVAESEILNLSKEVLLGENKQRELSCLKEEMCNKFNREIENNERIQKEHSKEVKELKAEIRNLRTQLSLCETKQENPNPGSVSAATPNGTSATKYAEFANKEGSRGQIHQLLSPTTTNQGLQCHRCESLYSAHQPNQCPARNFMCGYCSKRGHHTLNCLRVCRGCGAKGRAYHRLEDCTAQEMNCAYCSVRGHLTHMCLKKRYDTEGF